MLNAITNGYNSKNIAFENSIVFIKYYNRCGTDNNFDTNFYNFVNILTSIACEKMFSYVWLKLTNIYYSNLFTYVKPSITFSRFGKWQY